MENIRQHVYGGLSVEFGAIEQRRVGSRREIVKGSFGRELDWSTFLRIQLQHG